MAIVDIVRVGGMASSDAAFPGSARSGRTLPRITGLAKRLAALAGAGIVTLAVGCAAPRPSVAPPARAAASTPLIVVEDPGFETRIAASKGWGWLVEKLVADGVPRGDVAGAFADPRMPVFSGLTFSVEPREPHAMYRQVLRSDSVAGAKACRAENASAFESAERASGVPAEVVAAILHVETRCGRNTGDSIVLYGLARLAMANEPENLALNVDGKAIVDGVLDEELAGRVRARGAKLESMFLPEVRATFTVTERLGLGPLDLTGSPSGAFGYPQFLPTSYLRFGVDGDGDGRVDLYSLHDAAASAARYLAENGWERGIGRVEQRQAIWHYNRSDAYIDAVLGLSERIGPAELETAIGGL